jgi:trehalose 6-phosphate phosphatase
MTLSSEALARWVAEAPALRLFLDYDGTLADFSALPDLVEVLPDLVNLMRDLSARPRFRITIISGRKLQIVRKLVPVAGLTLAGVYGVEIQLPSGEMIYREKYERIRPFLDRLKPRWEGFISGEAGFYLEDKDWSLALHAGRVETELAREVLTAARQAAEEQQPADLFRWFEDDRFLEIAPLRAHKGKAVRYILGHFPFPGARLVYIGDDDKDEEAFETVHAFKGVNILVTSREQPVHYATPDFLIGSPRQVRRWLRGLLAAE